jgi:hypothetical protein
MQTLFDMELRSVLLRIACLVLSAFSLGHPGLSQEKPQVFRESLYIQTDRDLYVVGEQVWMKVYKLDARDQRPDDFSKVVYIEVLNQAGYPVNQTKLLLPEESGSLGLTLSDTLSSGNYLIRAYTSWMKNYPDRDFAFRTISVINPFRSMANIGVKSSLPVLEGADGNDGAKSGNSIHLEISFDKQEYGPRERIGASIRATDSSGHPVEADLSVSVVKSCLMEDSRRNIQDVLQFSVDPGRAVVTGGKEHTGAPVPFLPELEGVVLGGTLLNSTTDEPIRDKNIMLSIVGKAARCQIYRTNDRGEFYFNVDESGIQEIVVQPVDSSVSDYYIDLKPDYHSTYDHPLPGPFYLDTTKLRALNQSIINMQIERIYRAYRPHEPLQAPETSLISFYGEPEYQIQISDYIQLRNISEVIKEIVPPVSLRVKEGKSFFWMENGVDGLHFQNQALVLVDGVPYDEVDQILNIGITELDRIEVINLRYLLDGHMFEGIIHIVTMKGKMAGLEFDHTVFRQAFAGYLEESGFSSPEYGNDSLRNSPLPDFRNTLYWNPGLHAGENGRTAFEFYTSDDSGEYTLYLEGISGDGKSGSLTETLIVH